MGARAAFAPPRARGRGYNSRMDIAADNNVSDRKRLLVVDDEAAIADLVSGIFVAEGMEVRSFCDPRAALSSLDEADYDIAIVDIMMPAMDGFELCRNIRQKSDVPVVFLSAKDAESDIVAGFTIGADDYVTKPFKPRELVARVKAHLRRRERRSEGPRGAEGVLSARGIEVDTRAHTAALHDVPLQLTPKEFDILANLMRRQGEPVSSRELYQAAWGEPANASSSNTVMVHIRHLRCKLAEVDSSCEFIETAWGVGYRIAADKADGRDG